jgi:hypothetical protein
MTSDGVQTCACSRGLRHGDVVRLALFVDTCLCLSLSTKSDPSKDMISDGVLACACGRGLRHGDVVRLALFVEGLVAHLAGLAELEHFVLHVLLGREDDLCVCVCMYICMYVCMYVWVCVMHEGMCVCVCICVEAPRRPCWTRALCSSCLAWQRG